MTFEEAMAHIAEWKVEMDKLLTEIDFLTLPSAVDNHLSWDDVRLFPFVRNLTMVKDIVVSKTLLEYINQIACICGISLYFHCAK